MTRGFFPATNSAAPQIAAVTGGTTLEIMIPLVSATLALWSRKTSRSWMAHWSWVALL